MTRTRALGLDPVDLHRAGREAQRPDWQAAALFFEEYLDVLDAQNLIDYAELVHRAGLVLADPAHRAALHDRYAFVVVDEYQDTDPAQVTLLRHLAGGGRDLVAVGDPDQSIYAFRGADVSGILSFSETFRTLRREPAPVISLRRTRRFGPRMLAASRAIASRIPLGALPVEDRAFRDPVPTRTPGSDARHDEVVVRTFADHAAEAEHIALALRRAHLDEGLAWERMAVLARSGAAMPRLQRALEAAGVPVEVAGAEIPLRSEPAVAALLDAARLALARAEGRSLDADAVERYLTGPIGHIDTADLRILCQELRHADAVDDDGERRVPRPSRDLLVSLVENDAVLGPLGGRRARSERAEAVVRAAASAVDLLGEAAKAVRDQESPEQVLWRLWRGSDWERRLVRATEARGDAAGAAHRDLDAVVALFAKAARADESQRHQRLGAFLDELFAHEIPTDNLADRGQRGPAVRLLTAHRSKGLEWDLVVVAGVQDGTWPDVRPRGTLLAIERLADPRSAGGSLAPAPTAASLLAEERRLFYVAITRARSRLLVTAVKSNDPDGDQPSPFVLELAEASTAPITDAERRPRHGLSLRGVVAELREMVLHGATPRVRDEAARRLATLASSGVAEARDAHPDHWWGLREVTRANAPVRPLDEPIRLSGSSLDGIVSCPLSWFLKHEAKGETVSSSAQGFGLLVHALAADVVRRGVEADPVALDAALDEVWSHLSFAAPWISEREREEARGAIARFAAWHAAQEAAGSRRPAAAEHPFRVELEVAGETVVLRGSMDRVDIAVDGRVHVVDYKTGKHAPTSSEIAAHAQLGVYQLAIEHGAADELVAEARGDQSSAGGVRSGGAALVHLRIPDSSKRPDLPKVQPQDAPVEGESFFAHDLLERAVKTIRAEEWVATPSDHACRFCSFARVCPAMAEGADVMTTISHAATSDVAQEGEHR